jgi:hypothetical protein
MLPTQQHFGADRCVVFEAHEWLKHQPQVAVGESLREISFDDYPVRGRHHVRGVDGS